MRSSPAVALSVVVAVAVLYVRLAWWLARRRGRSSLLLLWLGAVAVAILVAALGRGPASADELLVARPGGAAIEAGVLAAIFALPAFGMAALSVRKRLARSPEGPTPKDWTAGVGAALLGALVPGVLLTLLVLIFWA